jgi:hypothetical protein
MVACDGKLGFIAKDVNGFNHVFQTGSTCPITCSVYVALQFFCVAIQHLTAPLDFGSDRFV